MIFSHIQKPLGMRKTRVGKRICVQGVPLDTTLFYPYCCATVDMDFATLRGTGGSSARTSVRLARLLVTPALRHPSERPMYRGATTKRRVRAATLPHYPHQVVMQFVPRFVSSRSVAEKASSEFSASYLLHLI
jgi:hypothetical protein